jgi:hypothetical protein
MVMDGEKEPKSVPFFWPKKKTYLHGAVCDNSHVTMPPQKRTFDSFLLKEEGTKRTSDEHKPEN